MKRELIPLKQMHKKLNSQQEFVGVCSAEQEHKHVVSTEMIH